MRRSFAQLAAKYPRYDFLAREVDGRMQERLEFIRLAPGLILDLGCSCGGSVAGLRQRFPAAWLFGLDAEPAMLRQVKGMPVVTARAQSLPLRAESVDLVWSNLLLHWLEERASALAEIRRVLKPGGLFLFSTLGPDTLKELRGAFPEGHSPLLSFTDMHIWGDLLVDAGFDAPVLDREDLTLSYQTFSGLLEELRRSSAGLVPGRGGLTTAGHWRQVAANYPHRAAAWPVTLELVFGHAWKPVPGGREAERPVRIYR